MTPDTFNFLVGLLSLIIGAISLYYSIIGYNNAKKAASEATAAKKLVQRMDFTKEKRLEFKESLVDIQQEENRIKKAFKLSSLLVKIHTTDESWNKSNIEETISDLQKCMNQLYSESVWDKGYNDTIMSTAEGLIAAYIDKLGKQIANDDDSKND